MNTITTIAAISAAFALAACMGGDEPPTSREIAEAVGPMYNAPVDAITGLNCAHRGPSKYQCEFTVSVIGRFPEERSDCMYATASGWMPMDAHRCAS